ncbi:hypothetical protein CL633_00500 [bacterium]|nr:hypothetical protein [bacterium]|tara:strand:+ start:12859 stop:13404 length:546 start_codon:yes stop_codon:yes gene_type:complete
MPNQIIDLRKIKKQKLKSIQKREPKSSNDVFLSWQIKEKSGSQKNLTWFIILAIITVGLVIFAFFSNSPLMALLFILISVVIYLSNFNKTEILKCKIAKQGLYMQKRFFPWNELESFWIFYDPPRIKILSIKAKKTLLSCLTMPLTNQNPSQIRKILLKYMPEIEQEESLIDTLAKKIGLC